MLAAEFSQDQSKTCHLITQLNNFMKILTFFFFGTDMLNIIKLDKETVVLFKACSLNFMNHFCLNVNTRRIVAE